jgi:hypothetical protein
MQPMTEFDDLVYPKAQAPRATEYVSASMVLTALGLTHADVTAALSAFEQEDLGAEDEAAATRALTKAAWWMLAKLRKTTHVLEDFIPGDVESLKEILTSRAVYELQVSTGQSGVASELRISIQEMATALFGEEFRPAESSDKPGSAVGVVAKSHRKRFPE